ncbi:MAG: hypothetical protein IPM18_11045 [Phycisphaerales bacterium]|nr:hypothetical protein [Phycisphaerales bacterium]
MVAAGSPGKGRRRGWRAALTAGGLILLSGPLVLLLGATWRPSWYRPASVDHVLLRTDKAALFQVQDEISAHLNAEEPLVVELHAAQLNRWLAAEGVWRELGAPAGPLEQPFVELDSAGVRIGGLVRWGSVAAVVSVRATLRAEGDELRCGIDEVRLGAWPVARSWWQGWAERATRRLAGHWEGVDFVHDNRFLWENGRRPYQIEHVEFGDGVVRARITPVRLGFVPRAHEAGTP